jgi:ribonucleotide reductase alpha subunit
MIEKTKKTYTKEQVEEATLTYFNNDQLATDVWIKKYCLKDDNNYYELSPDNMHRRLAKEFARIEAKYPNALSAKEIYKTIKNFKRIVPQGGSMSGIGNNFQIISLSNCFVIGNNKDSDSYGGIMKLDQDMVQLQKRRGGVGQDLSFIRPKGSPVKNSAITSTGIVPFMERYSNSTKEVAQDGRRGALMLSVSINHPDAEDFIDAKMSEGKVTGANVSVRLTDEFMKAAKYEYAFEQKYPIDSDNPKIIKEIDPTKLWKKIIHNAWKSGEPGILFWDKVISESIPDCYADLGFKTTSTNPCVTSDSWVMTNEGPKQVNELIGKDFTALVDNEQYLSKGGFFYTGDKKVYEVETNRGLKIKATDNHKFKRVIKQNRGKKSYEWVELGDLIEGDVLNLNYNKNQNLKSSWDSNYDDKIGWLIGSLVGDGSLVNETAYLRYWGENRATMKKIAVDLIKTSLNYNDSLGSGDDNNEIITVKSNPLGRIANDLGLFDGKNLGYAIESQSSDFYRGFISGILDADGTVLNNSKKGINVRLSSSNLNNLEVIQRMLLRLGIVSSIFKNRRLDSKKMLPDGNGGKKEYNVKAQHELVISKENLLVFNKRIGFKDVNKQTKLDNVLNNLKRGLYKEYFTDSIKSIKLVGVEDVYDCNVDIAHEFDCNGISVHNCGEIPLCPYDSCRLLALNLYGYVVNPFTSDSYFDWDLFKNDVIIAMRYMDDIIDLELEKIDNILAKIKLDPEDEFIKLYEINLWTKIREKAIEGRRTGLGVTAEGDMLAALSLTYGTDSVNDFSEKVHENLKLNAYKSSVILAKERGAFPIYDAKREKNNPFILRIKEANPELYADMVKYGRRNIALLTIAPTGTASLMTQTTSGIEPVFLPVYKRRRKINPQEKDIQIDFVDEEGIAWKEYLVFHNNFKTWLKANDYDVDIVKTMTEEQVDEIVKKSPYYKATSNDVDWVKKVEMQGRIQKHVDHSISVTVNLPEEATEDLVRQVYETGWSAGCKGMTVYREGSRSGVLISNNEKKEVAIEEVHAPKRGKRLKAEIHRFQNKLEKWIAVVGLKDGHPYEIFTGRLENGLSSLPPLITECEVVKNIIEIDELIDGKIVKVKRKRYDIEYIDSQGDKHIFTGLNHAFNPEFWNYAKFISGVLRHKMPLVYVFELIDSLNFKEDYINTWKNGVTRVIKRYIKDGEKGKGTCPVCGSNDLQYKEGCLICMGCGNSKCG